MTLFASLFGFWHPPAGWRRIRDSSTECELHHPELGTLRLERPIGFDAIPVNGSWVRAPRASFDIDVVRAFVPSGFALEDVHTPAGTVESNWTLRPKEFLETLFGR